MNEQHRDQLVEMMLRELVGGESPPDLQSRVLSELEDEFLPEAPEEGTKLKLVSGAVPQISSKDPLVRSRPVVLAKPSSSAWVLSIAAVLMLMAISIGLLAYRNSMINRQTPWVADSSGEVHLGGANLRPGASFSTGEEGRLAVHWKDGTRLELEPFSKVSIVRHSDWNPRKILKLEAGSIRAEVSPQPNGHPMKVQTVDAEAIVLGTVFTLSKNDQKTRLQVDKGRVAYHSGRSGEMAEVAAGGFAESGAKVEFSSGRIAPPAPELGVTGFVLMDAGTNLPIAGYEPMRDGVVLSFSELPTNEINIRVDTIGDADGVNFTVNRLDGGDPGTEKKASEGVAPFFVAGDYSAGGNPKDCRPWTPPPGQYRVTARAVTRLEGDERIFSAERVIEFEVQP